MKNLETHEEIIRLDNLIGRVFFSLSNEAQRNIWSAFYKGKITWTGKAKLERDREIIGLMEEWL